MTQETTNNPYPTIEEKVALFKENGIAVSDYFVSNRDIHDDVAQVIGFNEPGDAWVAAKVAKEHGITISELCLFWPFYANEPGESYSSLAFH